MKDSVTNTTNTINDNEDESADSIGDTIHPPLIRPARIVREIDQKAEDSRMKLVFPKIPGRIVNFEQFLEWQKLLSPEMVSNEDIYIYRHKPYIITDPKYIDVLKADDIYKLNREYVLKTHGGGDYGFDIYNRSDRASDRRIFQAKLSIPITDADPILDYATLDIASNKNTAYVTYLKNKGILDKDGKVVTATNTAKENMEGMGGVIQTILGFVEKLNTQQQQSILSQLKGMLPQQPIQDNTGIKEFIPLFLEKMKQENPGNQMQGMMTMFSSLLASVKEMQPSQVRQNNDNGISMKEILEMNNKHNETVMQLIQQIITIKTSGGKESDPLEMVEKVLNIKDRLENSIGGGKSAPQDKWDRIIDLGERILPVVFENVGAILQARMTGGIGLGNANPNPHPPKPRVSRDSANPFNNPEAARAPEGFRELPASSNPPSNIPTQETKPKPGLVEIPNQDTSNETMQQIAAIIVQFGDYIINSLRNGQAGYEFADTIANLPGVGIMPMQLIGQYGITETIELCKKIQDQQGNAIFWNNVKHLGEQYITKWLSDFVNFQDIIDKLEREENGEDEENDNNNKETTNKN